MQHLAPGQPAASTSILLCALACPALGLGAAWLSARLAGGGRPSARLSVSMIAAGLVLTGCAAARPGELGWSLALGWTLAMLASVDLAVFRLPDLLTLPLTGVGLIRAALEGDDLAGHVAGLGLGYAAIAVTGWAFERLRGRRGIGLGDAKLFAAAGAWLGWAALPPVMLIGCAVGLAWFAVAALQGGREALRAPIPFGVPLCCGFWAVWLVA